MTILITSREPNRADAERCILWALDYYVQQAEQDGIPLDAIGASVANLHAVRTELADKRPAIWATRL